MTADNLAICIGFFALLCGMVSLVVMFELVCRYVLDRSPLASLHKLMTGREMS